jgi:sugar (pentulose or hexulose) kinase
MSSTTILLVDFGASRIKSAAWSCDKKEVVAVQECAAPQPKFGQDGAAEISPEEYWKALESTAGKILQQHQEIDSLWLCTEMHGFLLSSPDSTNPLTQYISWRDERASKSGSLTALNKIADDFFLESGMRLRSGLPFATISYLNKIDKLAKEFRFLTLADWLLWRGGEKNPAIHSSLAAGTGLFSIKDGRWSKSLAKMAGLNFDKITFPKVVKEGEEIGRINIAGREIKVFGGIGDLQAAAYGAGFPDQAKLLINLGTGSQVLGQIDDVPAIIETRPGIGDNNFSAITHIPSGRALNVFANFFDDCAKLSGGKAFFWDIFSSLTTQEVLAAESNVNLAVFEAAWRYKNGGNISAILEGKFSPKNLISSISHSWLKQYSDAISEIDYKNLSKSFLLSGGLSRRGNFILPVLEKLTNRKGIYTSTITGEETLDGLLASSKNLAQND